MDLAIHEISEVMNLQKFIRHFGVDAVFDIGANTGQYARMLREKVRFEGWIFSFEPFSEAYAELEKASQDDQQWLPYNYAVSDTAGPMQLNLVGSSQMNSLQMPSTDETNILENINTPIGVETIQSVTLDTAYAAVAQAGAFHTPLLKLDTQGHDLTILSSSRDLSHFVGVQTEVAFKTLYENAPKYFEVIEFLKTRHFELTAIFPNNAGHFPTCIEQDILAFNTKYVANRQAS